MLIGRKKEYKQIVNLIKQKKNIFIFGKEGAGKTFLLKTVLKAIKPNDYFYSQDSSCLRKALQDFLESAFDEKFIASQNILGLRKLIYQHSKSGGKYFVFDHMVKSSSRLFSLTEWLCEHVPVIMVGRGPYYRDIGTMSYLLWNFTKIELANFSRPHVDGLIDFFINEYKLGIPEQAVFKEEVYRRSQGNPGIIEEICRYAQSGHYSTSDGAINFELIGLDRKISDIKL
jgi:energy-coupling factor transporter ATP-binding protein EcfA2